MLAFIKRLNLNYIHLFLNYLKDRILQEGAEIREKLKDIPKTNLELGKYHLQKGNLTDAILRFKLVIKLTPKNEYAYYYLADALFRAHKHTQAQHNINIALKMKANWVEAQYLLDKYTHPEQILTIPDSIILEENLNNPPLEFSLSKKARHARARFAIKHIARHITDKNPNLNVLDWGIQISDYALLLKEREFARSIDAVSLSSNFISYLGKLAYEQETIYHRLHKTQLHSFLQLAPQNEYQLILADHSFDYYGDLANVLPKICQLLTNEGILACIARTPSETDADRFFDPATNKFTFSRHFLNESFEKAGFKHLQTISLSLSPNPVPAGVLPPPSDASASKEINSNTQSSLANSEFLYIYQR